MSAAGDPPGAAATRPNVLFVICDQLRADHLGFAGNPVVRTPNIDRLAARGVVFDRAYVSNPVCMPNRSTLMTGRMPSAHGVIFNDRSLAPNVNTFVRQLRHAGYRTALIGKSHLQHGMSREAWTDLGTPGLGTPGPGTPGPGTPDLDTSGLDAPGVEPPFGAGWDTVEHDERYEAGEPIDAAGCYGGDFYGFDHIELSIAHGAAVAGHHYQWARERGATHEQLVAGFRPDSDVPERSPLWWQLHAAPYPDELYSTAFVTERTVDWIERRHAAGEAWMAWCSFPDPHHPLSPPAEWLHRHDPDDIELPTTFDDPGEGWPRHLGFLRSLTPSPDNWVMPFGPTPEQARAVIAATYGMIEFIDEGVGRILDTLDRLGIADDTIVVFTSDHGDMMGDHGLLLKAVMHFQGCLRVPMVVADPRRGASGHTSSLASSIDLPHTVLDLCGVGGFQGMQGHSLVPILDDRSATVRGAILVEDDFPAREVGRGLPLRTRTVITDDGRYSRDTDGQESMYDLAADPDEVVNLVVGDRDPTRRARLVDALTDELIRADDLTRLEPVSL